MERNHGSSGEIEAALRHSEQRYRFLFEENPSMYFTVDESGTVLSVNPFGAERLGYRVDELVGMPVIGVFHEADRQAVTKHLQTCLASPGSAFAWEVRKVTHQGDVMWVREVARSVRDLDDRLVVLIVCEDITARKRAEDDLRRARDEMERRVDEKTSDLEKQRAFLRQVIDVDPNFIFAKDRDGKFTLVNQAVADAYGTTVDELIGKGDADFNPHPDQVAHFREIDRLVMDTMQEHFIAEEWVTDSSGRARCMQTVKRPLLDEHGRATQVLGSATDISARREAEQKLRESEAALRRSEAELQVLAGRLMSSQEDEQRRLARELHDDLTQRLAGVAIQAGRLERLLTDRPEDARHAGQLRVTLAQISTDVHAFSRRLHPAILEDLGLLDAIAAECAALSQRGEVDARLSAEHVPEEIERQTALVLYRIAQEALRNVAKHAGTKRAQVTLRGEPGFLTLRIEDQGVGFDASKVRGAGLGLVSMGERARLIRARLRIDSTPARGSVVEVRVPLGGLEGSAAEL